MIMAYLVAKICLPWVPTRPKMTESGANPGGARRPVGPLPLSRIALGVLRSRLGRQPRPRSNVFERGAKLFAATAAIAAKIHPASPERSAVVLPNHPASAGVQKPLSPLDHPARRAPAFSLQNGQIVALKAHMLTLVACDLLAQRPQHGRAGGFVQGGVIHLRDDFRGNQHTNRHLEICEVPQPPKNAVRPGFAQPGNARQVEDPSQVAGVPMFFRNEEFDCFGVGGEAFPPAEFFSPPNQVFALGAFAQLKLLDRGGNGRQFRFVELGASPPRVWAAMNRGCGDSSSAKRRKAERCRAARRRA